MANVATTTAAQADPGRAARCHTGLTDRAKAERKLAWLLCAPAVIVMLFVAGFPIVYAFWLSLQRADLRFPHAGRVRRAGQLQSPCSRRAPGGSDVGNTLIITVVSVSIELVLGMLIAQAMYRAIFARTAIRASVLVPYGAVTVVAAFAWRLAFDPATGFVVALARTSTTPPLTTRGRLVLRDHHGGGLEDDALHRAAAARRPRARAGGPLQGGEGRRRHRRWQRFFRITLPLIKPALMVAVLFRTLDAFRIYDTVFIMTRGANNTETVSMLGYQQLVNRLNLGLGSAVVDPDLLLRDA